MKTPKTITVRQLIELLEDQNPDARVIFTANYGDRSRTEQALPLEGTIDETIIEESAYSQSGFALADSDANWDEDFAYLVIR